MKRRSGFTLLEAMVALGVILLLVGVMTSVVGNVARSRDRSIAQGIQLQGAMGAFELLGSAADTCFAGGAEDQSAIQGGPLNLRITRSGVPARRLRSQDGAASVLGDRERFELGLDGRDLFVSAEESNAKSILMVDLVAIRFRYFDGESWMNTWDSSIDGLPRAIELSIWSDPWPEGREPSWMPKEDTELLESEVSQDLEITASFDEEIPSPQKQRIVAIFDSVSHTPAIDVVSTTEDDSFGDFSP